MLNKKWTLGFKDRGHGHGDYAVVIAIAKDKASFDTEVVVETGSRELAEHIIELHNKSLEG